MSDWLAWQVVDSAFPTGAFAHSLGLESAWQHGEVGDAAALEQFVQATVLQTGYAALPLLNDAYRFPGRLGELDDLADAFLINEVANRASRIQGRTLAATAARIWPGDRLASLQHAIRQRPSHVAPVSGAVFQALGLSLETAQHVTLFAAARGVLTAAVRLGLAGSYEAQRLQHGCAGWLDTVAQCCRALGSEDLAQTAPVIDILQAGHDRLYSRLFQS